MPETKNESVLTVVIDGKPYSTTNIEDLAVLQRRLVPDNWPLTKREGVRLFLAHRAELSNELGRHLTKNWETIVKTAIDEKDDGNAAEVAVSFTFTLNFSALQVAARGKSKLAFKRNFSSTGKPVAHDLNQLEFLKDDLSASLDTDALIADSEPPKEEQIETPAATADAAPDSSTAPTEKPKKGRGRPKKTVAKGDKS